MSPLYSSSCPRQFDVAPWATATTPSRGLNPQRDVYGRTKSSHIFRHAKFTPTFAAGGASDDRSKFEFCLLEYDSFSFSFKNMPYTKLENAIPILSSELGSRSQLCPVLQKDT